MRTPRLSATLGAALGLALLLAGPEPSDAASPEAVERLLARIEWLASPHQYGSACVRLTGSRTIYVDPSGLRDGQCRPKADLILVTHTHDDHLSPASIACLSTPSTRVIGPPPGSPLPAGQRLDVQGVGVEAVVAYNTESQAHPRSAGGVGYVVTLDGVRVYHSGDTSLVPELRALTDIDIAIVTLRPTYMMSAAEILEATRSVRPRVLIPVHWLEAEKGEIETLRRGLGPATRLVLLQPR